MNRSFSDMLTTGGKTNSLGEAQAVIDIVLRNKGRLEELYECLFHDDSWVRMRAADSLEKVCRVHPEWLAGYVDRLLNDFSSSSQPSIQWHMAQIFGEVELSPMQRPAVVSWLKELLSTEKADWIVASNAMQTLVGFTRAGWVSTEDARRELDIQQNHASPAVVKRARKLATEL